MCAGYAIPILSGHLDRGANDGDARPIVNTNSLYPLKISRLADQLNSGGISQPSPCWCSNIDLYRVFDQSGGISTGRGSNCAHRAGSPRTNVSAYLPPLVRSVMGKAWAAE